DRRSADLGGRDALGQGAGGVRGSLWRGGGVYSGSGSRGVRVRGVGVDRERGFGGWVRGSAGGQGRRGERGADVRAAGVCARLEAAVRGFYGREVGDGARAV